MIHYDMTGLRVKFWHGNGWDFGVARVKYNQGHRNAGRYEVERDGKDPVLVHYQDCETAPNWDDTPPEHRFTGAEFYLPSFIDNTRRAFLSASCGVMIPGDMDRMRELADKVRPNWRIQWFGRGANEFRGELIVGAPLSNGNGFRLHGGKGAPLSFTWPTGGITTGPQYAHEFEVTGTGLHIVRVPPKRTGKSASRSLSMEFSRPYGR